MLKAVFWDYKEDSRGAWLKCHIPSESIDERFIANVMHGEMRIDDGRRISSDQRKKIYALIKDIADHTGHHPEYLKEHMKYEFMMKEDRDYFSLSSVDMTTARYFIDSVLEFCFEWDIPLSYKTNELAKEVGNYLYLCLKFRKCAVCGKKADIHHCTGSRIGMGNDRNSVSNENREVIALCREHHNEIHSVPEKEFFAKYHVGPLKLNRSNVKELRL